MAAAPTSKEICVRGPCFLRPVVVIALAGLLLLPNLALATTGPGVAEKAPISWQFLALAAWVGLAVVAVLLWPISAIIRFFRRRGQTPPPHPQATQPEAVSTTTHLSEPKTDGSHGSP
jgi:membrane protein implicated in regulation of membrane protease activity